MGIHPFDDDQMPLRGFSWSSCSTAPVTPNGASAPTTERLDMEGLSGALMAQVDLGKGLRPAASAGGLANQSPRRRRRRRPATPEASGSVTAAPRRAGGAPAIQHRAFKATHSHAAGRIGTLLPALGRWPGYFEPNNSFTRVQPA